LHNDNNKVLKAITDHTSPLHRWVKITNEIEALETKVEQSKASAQIERLQALGNLTGDNVAIADPAVNPEWDTISDECQKAYSLIRMFEGQYGTRLAEAHADIIFYFNSKNEGIRQAARAARKQGKKNLTLAAAKV
jgi:hypothetical protein